MKRLLFLLILLLTGMLLTSCSSQNFNRDVYQMLQDRECVRDLDVPGCDRGQPSYEEYREARDSLKQQ
jgi:hypothetical protein